MTFTPRRLLCAVLLFYSVEAGAAERMAGGLLFVGDHPGFKWGTTLVLSPNGVLPIPAATYLQFDFAIWNPRQYGTILSLNAGPGKYLMLTFVPDGKNDSSYIALSWHEGKEQAKTSLARASLGRGEWHTCELRMEFQSGRISLRVDSLSPQQLRFSPVAIPEADILFGYEAVQREGAQFALRNVKLLEPKNEAGPPSLRHWWPLQQFDGTEVPDQVGGVIGRQSMGEWLLPLHSKWTLDRQFGPIEDSTSFLLFDQLREQFLLVARDTLYTISRHDSTIGREPFVRPHAGRYHRLLYDDRRNRLFTFHEGGGRVTEFSFPDRSWPAIDSSTEFNQYNYGSATWVDPASGDLWMFGGYGWYTLKNGFYRYDFKNRRWQPIAVHGDTISPRMNSAAAIDERGRVYIAGGIGNSTGKQESGTRQFSDLWQFDPATMSLRRLWTSSKNLDDGIIGAVHAVGDSGLFLLASKDWAEKEASARYATLIAYPSLQRLVTLRLPDNCFRTRLLMDSRRGQINLVVEILANRKEYSFRVYTLEYPPVPHSSESDNPTRWGAEVAGGIAIAIGGFIVARIYWKRARKKKGDEPGPPPSTPQNGESVSSPARIEVLGGFHIHDTRGNDLALDMRRQVAQVFMVLLIHSLNDQDGIGADRLTALFWPNIDPRSARNSRNVAIKHLRDILSNAGIAIQFSDDTYRLRFPDGLGCDYYKLRGVLTRIADNPAAAPEALIREFLGLAGKGQLFSGKDYDWLEGVRTDLVCDVTRVTGVLLRGSRSDLPADLTLEIAEIAILWDPLNEAAMRVKLRILLANGLHSEAIAEFEKFAVRYESTFHHPFVASIQNFLRE